MTELVFVSPSSADDWERYYDLRWRILRAPWNQPRGSEKDDREAESSHLMAFDHDRRVIAVGRLHLNSPSEAQVRFMAVPESARGRGLGSALLEELEAKAAKAGAVRIVLNAREEARPFYEKNGYVVLGPAPTMFDVVKHVRMTKQLRR